MNTQNYLKESSAKLDVCLHGAAPRCSTACPFGLDIRKFLDKVARGNFNAAFRLYRDATLFPKIVSAICPHPCADQCIRAELNGAINLGSLEKAVLTHASQQEPNHFNLPPETKRVAVIGGGPAGLACALKLAAKKYRVTLYEQNQQIGGALWNHLPPQVFLDDIHQQFKFVEYQLRLECLISDLCQIDEEAVCIATGIGGHSFGFNITPGHILCDSERGVVLCGMLTGADLVTAIAQGAQAALWIERWLKVGAAGVIKKEEPQRLWALPACGYLPSSQPVFIGSANFSKAEAQAEADRCLRCDCTLCIDRCYMMRHFQQDPKRICREVAETVQPETFLVKQLSSTRLIASCQDCGLCNAVCPLPDMDLGRHLMLARSAMVDNHDFPAAFHDFWLRDMEFSSQEARLAHLPVGMESCKWLFFPGCRLGGSDPRYVLESYRCLLQSHPDTGLLLDCCGVPAYWSGNTDQFQAQKQQLLAVWERFGHPTMILACPTCRRIFTQELPAIHTVSLWELLLQSPIPHPKHLAQAALFDACGARNDKHLRDCVRQLLHHAGQTWAELPEHGALTQCCSFGGQTDIANPTLVQKTASAQTAVSPLPYLVYCANCREVFAGQGKDCRHILDVLFGLNDSYRPPVDISRHRENRLIVKREALANFWGEIAEEHSHSPQLFITDELRALLHQRRLLAEDIRTVIANAESSGKRLREENGAYIAHQQIGALTYWARYQPEKSGYRLLNAYSHRMQILEDEV